MLIDTELPTAIIVLVVVLPIMTIVVLVTTMVLVVCALVTIHRKRNGRQQQTETQLIQKEKIKISELGVFVQ